MHREVLLWRALQPTPIDFPSFAVFIHALVGDRVPARHRALDRRVQQRLSPTISQYAELESRPVNNYNLGLFALLWHVVVNRF